MGVPWKRKYLMKRRIGTLLIVSCFIILVTLKIRTKPATRLKIKPKQRNMTEYMPESLVKYVMWKRQMMTQSQKKTNELFKQRAPYKTIVAYPHDMHSWEVPLGKDFFDQCPIKHCIVTNDTDVLDISDAVVFHMCGLGPLPPKKHAHEKWILYSQESPSLDKSYRLRKVHASWRGLFNYTSTYREDSDIPIPYGRISKGFNKRSKRRIYTDIIKNKTKQIAWMVSHCETDSLRSLYVKELSKYVPVDVIGQCGSITCPRDIQNSCLQMLNDHYKFYFAAENSFCHDYVTEKMFNTWPLDVIPVVRGGANYSNIFPPGTYIDVLSFKSVKALADYLIYLDRHPEEYLKFLKRKEDFLVKSVDPWCEICKYINQEDLPVKIYDNVYEWMIGRGCFNPPDSHKFEYTWWEYFRRVLH